MFIRIDPATLDTATLLARLQSGVTDAPRLFAGLTGADVSIKTSTWPLPEGHAASAPGTRLEAVSPTGEIIACIREHYDGTSEIDFTVQADSTLQLSTGETTVDFESSTFRTDDGHLTFYDADGFPWSMNELTFRERE